jgi:hypothetical protein
MRNNGAISPKRILTLVIAGEQHEYLRYFEEDSKYVKFVEDEFNSIKERITAIYNDCKDIVNQKVFALTIKEKTVYSFEQGILFSMRKYNQNVNDVIKAMGAEKLAKGINLKGLFAKKFNIVTEEEA